MTRTIYLDPHVFHKARALGEREIITPNPVAARALGARARNLPDLAAQILSEHGLSVASQLAARRTLQQAAREQFSAEGAAAALAPTLQKILRAGIDLSALAQSESGRARRLARVAIDYREALAGERLVDQDDAIWQAARQCRQRQPLLVYYPRLSADEALLVDAAADDNSAILLPYTDHRLFADIKETLALLEQRGWRVEYAESAPQAAGERAAHAFLNGGGGHGLVRAYAYAHVEEEVRATLAEIKALIKAGSSYEEIALVTRDESLYAATLLAVAWEYALPVRILYETPVTETYVGTWLRLLLKSTRRGLPFEHTARFLNHPLSAGLSDAQWQKARRQQLTGLAEWQQLTGQDLSLLDWPRQDERVNYARRLRQLLEDTTLRARAGQWERETRALEKLANSVAAIAAPAHETIDLETFARDVKEALAVITVPLEPRVGGIELHMPALVFGARYRHLFVLGMAEQVMPEPVAEDRLLDFHERKRLQAAGLQLESAAQAVRREAHCFWSMLQTASDTITLSYAKLLNDRETLPSSYFAMVGAAPAPPPARAAASIEEARRAYLRREAVIDDPVRAQAQHALAVESRRESSLPCDEYDGVVGTPVDPGQWLFSASQLTDLGQCPFKWFVGHLLGLEAGYEDDSGPTGRGQLYHRALQLLLSWVKGASNARQAALARLEEALAEAERLEALPVPFAREAQRREDLNALRRAVLSAEFLAGNAQALCFETKFYSQWRGLNVTGDLDRIDHSPEGLIIIDYKSGSSAPLGAKSEDGRARLDVQLPLYMHAALALFPGEKIADAYYYSIRKAKVLKKAKPDDAALDGLATRVKAHLHEGCYPVAPDLYQEVCSYCHFDSICRRSARLNRKINHRDTETGSRD